MDVWWRSDITYNQNTLDFNASSCFLSSLLSAVVGGSWAGLLIDRGVADTSKGSKGGSGALIDST